MVLSSDFVLRHLLNYQISFCLFRQEGSVIASLFQIQAVWQYGVGTCGYRTPETWWCVCPKYRTMTEVSRLSTKNVNISLIIPDYRSRWYCRCTELSKMEFSSPVSSYLYKTWLLVILRLGMGLTVCFSVGQLCPGAYLRLPKIG